MSIWRWENVNMRQVDPGVNLIVAYNPEWTPSWSWTSIVHDVSICGLKAVDQVSLIKIIPISHVFLPQVKGTNPDSYFYRCHLNWCPYFTNELSHCKNIWRMSDYFLERMSKPRYCWKKYIAHVEGIYKTTEIKESTQIVFLITH